MAQSTTRIIAIIAATLCTSVALAAQRTFDKQLNAPPGGRLTFDADVGSVTVVGHDGPNVVVHGELEGSQSVLDRVHISAEQTSSGVTISVHTPHSNWTDWLSFGSSRVQFTVEVPRDYPAELLTSGGDIAVRDLNASVRGKTSGGDISLKNVTGEVDLHTSGGDVEADRVNGTTELTTSGGGITVTESTGNLDVDTSGGNIRIRNDDGSIQAHTSGGNIRAQLRANRGISLETSGGGISLLLPSNAGGSVDAETSGGSVTSSLPLSTTQVSAGDRLVGTIGGGGAPISLRTSGGSIDIGKAN